MNSMRLLPVLLRWSALVACTSGCVAGGESPPRTISDSAGIRIVHNFAPRWGPDEAWSLSTKPLVSIENESASYQLHNVYSARRLSDGRIVAANSGSNALLFFEATGHLIRTAGGAGSGPGEFKNLAFIWVLPGDTIYAFDWLGGQLSVFDSAGAFVRSARVVTPSGGMVAVRGVFTDRSVVTTGFPDWSVPTAAGLSRDSAPAYRHDSTGQVTDTLGVFPSRDVFAIEFDGRMTMTDPPFPRMPITTVAGERFIFGAAGTAAFEIRGLDGTLHTIVRYPGGERTVTPEDERSYRERRLLRDERFGFSHQQTERILAQTGYPEEMPAYSQIRISPTGHIWVESYQAHPTDSTTWFVFTPEGVFEGDVRMPEGFQALDIGEEFVLGRTLDDMGSERLVMYALLTPR